MVAGPDPQASLVPAQPPGRDLWQAADEVSHHHAHHHARSSITGAAARHGSIPGAIKSTAGAAVAAVAAMLGRGPAPAAAAPGGGGQGTRGSAGVWEAAQLRVGTPPESRYSVGGGVSHAEPVKVDDISVKVARGTKKATAGMSGNSRPAANRSALPPSSGEVKDEAGEVPPRHGATLKSTTSQ